MKPWSRKHPSCLECHTTNYKHMARGLCHHCYYKDYAATHQHALREYKHNWWKDAGGIEYSKLLREQRHFDGKRAAVLNRDGHTCQQCGSQHQLVVHHKDGSGRGSSNPNNNLSNLKTLCRKCHMETHNVRLKRKCYQ